MIHVVETNEPLVVCAEGKGFSVSSFIGKRLADLGKYSSVHTQPILGLDSCGQLLLTWSADTCAVWKLSTGGQGAVVERQRNF